MNNLKCGKEEIMSQHFHVFTPICVCISCKITLRAFTDCAVHSGVCMQIRSKYTCILTIMFLDILIGLLNTKVSLVLILLYTVMVLHLHIVGRNALCKEIPLEQR